MNCKSSDGFTLVEMLTVMLVIAVLAALVLGINTGVQYKAAVARAGGEMAQMISQCENYKTDNGVYPRDEKFTDKIDPRIDGLPMKYKDANLVLYKALSGDLDLNSIPDPGVKSYLEFPPQTLNATKVQNKISTAPDSVKYIQDPWGNCWGYSTACAKQEEEYVAILRTLGDADPPPRPTPGHGHNTFYDLWSTGGSNSDVRDGTTGRFRDEPKWVKNW